MSTILSRFSRDGVHYSSPFQNKLVFLKKIRNFTNKCFYVTYDSIAFFS